MGNTWWGITEDVTTEDLCLAVPLCAAGLGARKPWEDVRDTSGHPCALTGYL